MYASVFVVLSGAALYTAVHAYVEYIALFGRHPIKDDDDDNRFFSRLELIPLFSGAHRGGGTDPVIGWRARNAARGAWLALNLSSGGVSLNTRSTNSAYAVPDRAWLSAEQYLMYAISQIDQRLEGPEPVHRENLMAAKLELLVSLAETRFRLGGPKGLQTARQAYNESLEVLEGDTVAQLRGTLPALKLDINRRLADIDLLLTNLVASRIPENELSRRRQDGHVRLLALLESAATGTTSPAHSVGSSSGTTAATLTPSEHEDTIMEPRRRGWTSFWSSRSLHRSAGAEQAPPPRVSTARQHSIDHLQTLAPMTAPALARAIMAIMQSLLVSAASRRDMLEMERISKAAHDFSRSLLENLPNHPSAHTSTESRALEDSAKLYRSWLLSRDALFLTYCAEIQAARGPSAAALLTVTDAERPQDPQSRLDDAIALSQQALEILKTLPDSTNAWQPVRLSLPLADTRRSASLAGAMAAQVSGTLAEMHEEDYKKAIARYETSLAFLHTSKRYGTGVGEATAREQAITGSIRRCRERLQPAIP